MKNISEVLEGVKTIGIGGHVRPDGDCVGSCMALYLYIRTYFPDVDVSVYLDHPKPIFGHIDHIDDIKTEVEEGIEFDLLPAMSARVTAWQLREMFLTMRQKPSASIIM